MEAFQVLTLIMMGLFQIIIPIYLVYWLVFHKTKSKLNLIFKIITTWTYWLVVFYMMPWSQISVYFRYLWMALISVGSLISIYKSIVIPFIESKNAWAWLKLIFQFLVVLMFGYSGFQIIPGYSTELEGINISYPLKEGYIAHGGASTSINYHHADTTAQHFAIDIVRLNKFGRSSVGLFPINLEDYTIYGDTIYAPCSGKVVRILDGLDNIPPGVENSTDNPAGNHVIIQYKDALIVFAHIQKNSIKVNEGETVKDGQPIGLVGNSGHTSEPHLHIHAVRSSSPDDILTGKGIPIFFEGEFATRNDNFSR